MRPKTRGLRAASPQETACYTYDMLVSLKRLAELSKQPRLAALLEAAATEAQTVLRNDKGGEK